LLTDGDVPQLDLGGWVNDNPPATLRKAESCIDALVDTSNELLAQTSAIAAPS
jgi:hypothetical protein